jgi:hypothetical protein
MNEITEVEANEALVNIGKLCGRISSDEGKRLHMLASTLMKYKKQLEKKVALAEQLEKTIDVADFIKQQQEKINGSETGNI